MNKKIEVKKSSVKHKHMLPQLKKIKLTLERAQENTAAFKKAKLERLKTIEDKNSVEYKELSQEIKEIRTIADSTKDTYYGAFKKVFDVAYEKYGITHVKDLTSEVTNDVLNELAKSGASANTVRNYYNSVSYINDAIQHTNTFTKSKFDREGNIIEIERDIELIDKFEALEVLHENGVKRSYKDSTKYKPHENECERVLERMYELDPELARIAEYSYETGFRISDCIAQKTKYVDVENGNHFVKEAKGGLDNIVHVEHPDAFKSKVDEWKNESDKETGRLFPRRKDVEGNYKSDATVRREISELTRKAAKELGIGSPKERFTTHSLRSGFGYKRAVHYAKNQDGVDKIISQRIKEQPRLREKYNEMLSRAKSKFKNSENAAARELTMVEKISWLVSVDLNHSRDDVTRYYIDRKTLKNLVNKHKN